MAANGEDVSKLVELQAKKSEVEEKMEAWMDEAAALEEEVAAAGL